MFQVRIFNLCLFTLDSANPGPGSRAFNWLCIIIIRIKIKIDLIIILIPIKLILIMFHWFIQIQYPLLQQSYLILFNNFIKIQTCRWISPVPMGKYL